VLERSTALKPSNEVTVRTQDNGPGDRALVQVCFTPVILNGNAVPSGSRMACIHVIFISQPLQGGSHSTKHGRFHRADTKTGRRFETREHKAEIKGQVKPLNLVLFNRALPCSNLYPFSPRGSARLLSPKPSAVGENVAGFSGLVAEEVLCGSERGGAWRWISSSRSCTTSSIVLACCCITGWSCLHGRRV
jgi:hypothetical protein